MNATNQLFTIEEAFVRLGQTRGTGCLVVFTPYESAHLFTRDGFVISAFSAKKEGETVLEHALQMVGGSYSWIPGAVPPKASLAVNIHSYVLKHAIARDTKIAETSRLALKLESKEKKSVVEYFLVPEEHPATQIKLTKATSIVGRDEGCDIVIDVTRISRRHCLFDITGRGLFVRDLDSSNGTFVNGRVIKEGYINPKDRLTLGNYSFIVHKEQLNSGRLPAPAKVQKVNLLK